MKLADLKDVGAKLPQRFVFHGVEGIGKTSLGTKFPKPVFLQARDETGLSTLLDNGRVEKTRHFPEAQTWAEYLEYLELLRTEEHDLRTAVIDALGGFETLCHEHVIEKDFGGDGGPDGFLAYGKGPQVAAKHWLEAQALLDRLRVERGMTIVILAHTAVKAHRNPTGADYDRFTVAANDKTWAITHKWADAVLFMNYEVFVEGGGGKMNVKGKASGKARMMYCERDAAWDAKNRHGLPAEIALGNSLDESWAAFVAAMKAGKAGA